MHSLFAYDPSYDPAAPVIEIGAGPSDGTPPRLKVMALLDTGADATMIPKNILNAAGARYVQRRGMRGVTGVREVVNLHLVTIHIGEHTIHGIRAVASSLNAEVIVGRDVLNNLTITLHGLAQEAAVSA